MAEAFIFLQEYFNELNHYSLDERIATQQSSAGVSAACTINQNEIASLIKQRDEMLMNFF